MNLIAVAGLSPETRLVCRPSHTRRSPKIVRPKVMAFPPPRPLVANQRQQGLSIFLNLFTAIISNYIHVRIKLIIFQ